AVMSKLREMYWVGVRRDLESVLRTLKLWQQPDYMSNILPDEEDHFIHGYDTFIDQVSQESRAFANRYRNLRSAWIAGRIQNNFMYPVNIKHKDYKGEMRDQLANVAADEFSAQLKSEVRDALEGSS